MSGFLALMNAAPADIAWASDENAFIAVPTFEMVVPIMISSGPMAATR